MRIRRRVRRLRSAAEMRDWARWIWRSAGLSRPERRWASRSSFFSLLQFLFQGLLAGQKLLKFFLWPHSCRW